MAIYNKRTSLIQDMIYWTDNRAKEYFDLDGLNGNGYITIGDKKAIIIVIEPIDKEQAIEYCKSVLDELKSK